jgi:hypothetical protein
MRAKGYGFVATVSDQAAIPGYFAKALGAVVATGVSGH